MANDGFRHKKEGPIHFVFQGEKHVGNVIAPTLGGDNVKAQKFRAISRLWGKISTHDSKHAAMEWLKGKHGESMHVEETSTDTTHDVLRDNGWRRAKPYGFAHHLAADDKSRYVHQDVPGHHIIASHRNEMWQHHDNPKGHQARTGHGTKQLHSLLQKLHAPKTIEGNIKEFVQRTREEHPDDWKEMLLYLTETNHGKTDIHIRSKTTGEREGETLHSKEEKHRKHNKIRIMKHNPYGLVPEEFYDKEKNEKDPKAGPKGSGLKMVSSDDAEGVIKIKKTMTGQPGPEIEINPIVQSQQDGRTVDNALAHKKQPQTN